MEPDSVYIDIKEIYDEPVYIDMQYYEQEVPELQKNSDGIPYVWMR